MKVKVLNVLLTGELVLPPPPSFKTVHFAPGVNSGEQEPPPIPTEVIRELGLDELAKCGKLRFCMSSLASLLIALPVAPKQNRENVAQILATENFVCL